MQPQLSAEDVKILAPSGHYIALRVGFAFPLEEVNALPERWVEYYTVQRFMMQDPVIRWIYGNSGAIRWSAIEIEDPRQIMRQAASYGLRYGMAFTCSDGDAMGQRSFGTFARADREFNRTEMAQLAAYVAMRHEEKAPPTNLTRAELEALKMVKNGMRLKQIAFELGVSEGAIKQRLKNAKLKLGANTGAQAAAKALEYGLIV